MSGKMQSDAMRNSNVIPLIGVMPGKRKNDAKKNRYDKYHEKLQ